MRISEKELDQPYWALSPEEIFEILETSPEGLTEGEAENRLKEFGRNVLPKAKRATKLKIFLNQFKSPLILILLIAGVVTLVIQDFKGSAVIFAALLVNAALGFYQENKAETALRTLRTYIKERARIIRDGKEKEIDAEELAPGDQIRLFAGLRVPADARVYKVNNFLVDEAILTGESLPVQKSTEKVSLETVLADRSSMVWGGTLVSEGVGIAVVVGTGGETELGRVAALVGQEEAEKTPLQLAITRFSIRAGLILVFLTATLFTAGLLAGYRPYEMFLIGVAAAVSAVPEGLPVALTVILAVGVLRLAKQKGVVRKLLAVEALGSTTLILTDKTGTLTQAKMELVEVISHRLREEVLRMAILTTDVIVENPDDSIDEWRVIGRPLDAALVKAGAKAGISLEELFSQNEIVNRKPFNSLDKFSAIEVKSGSDKFQLYLGAPEYLIERAKLREAEKENLILQVDNLAFTGHRVLGLLREAEKVEFVGLLAFRDPVRPEVRGVIAEAGRAGIKTVIVTGDHKGTALSVAQEVGIEAEKNEIITGSELEKTSDKELAEILPRIKIFARVTPEQKLKLVKLYQEKGETVAVTGDGVNDAPALKAAHIGVAVGSGTDVAQAASDLIILDDNFKTIVAAVGEGRKILTNIRKVIIYLLSDSLDELFLIGGALVWGLPLPLNALQILWVNFFSDSFPAVALAFEDGGDYLRRRPFDLRKRLLDREMRFLILGIGTASSALLFVLYFVLLGQGLPLDIVRTFIFASFSLYTLFLVFSIRSLEQGIFRHNPFSNHYLVAGVAIGIFLTLAAIYLPSLQNLLGTVSLPWPWLLGVVGVGVINITAIEITKLLFRKSNW